MKHFLDFYIKDISIPPGIIKPSNKTGFKPDDWLKVSLCLLKKNSGYLPAFTVWARGLKGSKLFVCGFKVAKMPSSTSIRPLTNHKEPKQFILLKSTKLWSVRNSQTEWDLPWAGRSVNLSSLCFWESRGSSQGAQTLSPQVLLSCFQKQSGQVRETKQCVFSLTSSWDSISKSNHLHFCCIQTD